MLSVSGFKNSTGSPRLAFQPLLFAAAKPRFASLRITVTDGIAADAASRLPSSEALSTTMISQSAAVASRERRHL
jgi:hypothetical protein